MTDLFELLDRIERDCRAAGQDLNVSRVVEVRGMCIRLANAARESAKQHDARGDVGHAAALARAANSFKVPEVRSMSKEAEADEVNKRG